MEKLSAGSRLLIVIASIAISVLTLIPNTEVSSTPFAIQSYAYIDGGKTERNLYEIPRDQWEPIDVWTLPDGTGKDSSFWLIITGTLIAPMPEALHVTGPLTYEVYLNGEYLGRNGRLDANGSEIQVGKIDALYAIPSDLRKEQKFTLTFRSHKQNTNTIAPFYVRFGQYDDLMQERYGWLLPSLVMIGAILLAIGFFTIRSVIGTNDVLTWLFIALGLSYIALLTIEHYRTLINYPYPLHDARQIAFLSTSILVSGLLIAITNVRFGVSNVFLKIAVLGIVSFTTWGLVRDYDGTSWIILTLASSLCAYIATVHSLEKAVSHRLWMFGLWSHMGIIAFGYIVADEIGVFLAGSILFSMLIADLAMVTLEAERVKARTQERLVLLKNQLMRQVIKPHFMLNSLNLLLDKAEETEQVDIEYSTLLTETFQRFFLTIDKEKIPLKDELDLCAAYCKLFEQRHEKPYRLNWQCDDLDYLTPPGLLMNLIENSLSHNDYPDGAIFHFTTSKQANVMQMNFASPLGNKQDHEGMGLGTSYMKEVLDKIHPGMWSYNVRQCETEHVFTLKLPSNREK